MRPRSTIIAMTLALAAAGCASTVQRPADLTQLGVADAARLIGDRKIISAELAQAYIARADANQDLKLRLGRFRFRYDMAGPEVVLLYCRAPPGGHLSRSV